MLIIKWRDDLVKSYTRWVPQNLPTYIQRNDTIENGSKYKWLSFTKHEIETKMILHAFAFRLNKKITLIHLCKILFQEYNLPSDARTPLNKNED